MLDRAPSSPAVPLEAVLRRLGGEVIRHLAGPDPEAVAVRAVRILDVAEGQGESGQLLLAAGAITPVEALAAGAAAGAAALVVRGDGGSPATGRLAPEGVCVLGIDPEMTWTAAFVQLAAALDGALAEHAAVPADGGPAAAGGPVGELFALADAAAAALRGHVLVLDAQRRLLAFSGEGETDEWRRLTVLGRGVPEAYERRFAAAGIYAALREPGRVVPFDLWGEPGFRPRRYIGVHAGGRQIGLIAAAEGGVAFDERADQVLREVARMAALPLLRHLSRHAMGVHGDEERVRELLDGRGDPTASAARLGLADAEGWTVAAVAPVAAVPAGDAQAQPSVGTAVRLALPEGVAAIAARDGSRLHLVLAGDPVVLSGLAGDPALAARLGPVTADHVVGLADPTDRPEGLSAAREEADRVVDALLAGGPDRRVAGPAHIWRHAVLADVRRLLRSDEAVRHGHGAALLAHDRAHGTDYGATVLAYLQAQGDAAASASALHIHRNTLRYRVRRAAEIAGVDLADPTDRLLLELQLEALLR